MEDGEENMGLDSQHGYQLTQRESEVAREIVNCAYRVHREIGPGMLEHVYEVCFCHELQKSGVQVQRQVWRSVTYDNIVFEEAYRMDVVVEDLIIASPNEVFPTRRRKLKHPAGGASLRSCFARSQLLRGESCEARTARSAPCRML